MHNHDSANYERIAAAIAYIQEHFREQPALDKVAAHVHLSPYHFQRLFSEWAGVSPKKFLQYISIAHARVMLRDQQTIWDTALETGLSGTGRLHDLFVQIESMTPGEYKNGGQSLDIHYSFAGTLFGNILIASTTKGICYLCFADDAAQAVNELKDHFPNAAIQERAELLHGQVLDIFKKDWHASGKLRLHLKGTDFQIKVWEALLKIPAGQLGTYGDLARDIALPGASRAVGTAIGSNPVAFLIPCHRVIRSDGTFGQYHWGSVRKTAMIGWEAVRPEQ